MYPPFWSYFLLGVCCRPRHFPPTPEGESSPRHGAAVIGPLVSEHLDREMRRSSEGVTGSHPATPSCFWSGRPDSNRRRPAWEAGILPLNYGRPATPILQLFQRPPPPLFPV